MTDSDSIPGTPEDKPTLERETVSILSPLRYPGSKRRLAGYIEYTLKQNRIEPDLFVEPFAGGASVALQLLKNNSVKRIGLADVDPLIYSFWYNVFHNADWLIGQIRSIEISLDKWD